MNGKDKDKLIAKLLKENAELKQYIANTENRVIITASQNPSNDSNGFEFHWDGKGSYEEARRCFYGDFS